MTKKLVILFLIFFYIGSFDSLYARRVREGSKIYNYPTLLEAFVRGERLVHQTGNVIVNSPQGWRNLKHLNAIQSYYHGPEALYWLEMDAELAIRNGYIPWEGRFRRFEADRFNYLPSAFIESLGAHKAIVHWRTFFEWENILESHTDTYKGNEGLIRFAFEHEIKDLTKLYDTFSYKIDELGWDRLTDPLRNLKEAQRLFQINPYIYIGDDGIRRLSCEANITHPRILYYARGEFEGYSDEKFKWTEDVLSDKKIQAITKTVQILADQTSLDIDMLDLNIQKRFYNLVQFCGIDQIANFLIRAGKLGADFITKNETSVDEIVQLTENLDNWQKYFSNYLEINQFAKQCSRVYGRDAKALSEQERQVPYFNQSLKTIEWRIRVALYRVNDLILNNLQHSSKEVNQIAIQDQKDLLLILHTLSLYKEGRLKEIIPKRRLLSPWLERRHVVQSPYATRTHIFAGGREDYEKVVLKLHDQETEFDELGILWEVVRPDGHIISIKLYKDRKTATLRLDLHLTGQSYKFNLGDKRLSPDANVKVIVRIFY